MRKKLIALCICMFAICTLAFADADVDLYRAIKIGNLSNVQSALRAGANPNQRFADIGGRTIFEIAVQRKDTMIVETIIKNSYIPVAIDGNGETIPPLIIAIQQNDDRMVNLLLKNGADINAKMDDMSIIMYAVEIGSRNILDVILKTARSSMQTIDFSCVDNEGNNIMHFAFKTGNSDIVNTIYRYAPQEISILINKRNNSGLTPPAIYLRTTNRNIDPEFFRTIINIPVVNILTFEEPYLGQNYLFDFCIRNPDMVSNLFRYINNRDITQNLASLKSKDRIPLLCYAVEEGFSRDFVEFLIKESSVNWKTITHPKDKSRFSGMNAKEIMRTTRMGFLYEDIFDSYY